jgi:transposase, IS30 family
MEAKKFVRLTLSERVIIETLLGEKRSKSDIAKQLGRSRSTISNEVNRWVVGSQGVYRAELAYGYSTTMNDYKRRKDKITLSKALRVQVFRGLLSHLSPELISGRLKLMFPNDPTMNVSYESIYRFIYAHPQGALNQKMIRLLVRRKSRRRKPKKRADNRTKIAEGIGIGSRPLEAEDRLAVGHWEGDLLIGPKGSSCIGSIVERKTRYALLVKLSSKRAKTVRRAFARRLNQQPAELRKTMTYDNGTEMAEHKRLTQQTGVNVYFAHPYSSWERGTNENTNGLVRRYYSKKTDFRTVSKADLERLEEHLNNRPRKVLGYYTPKEMYHFEIRNANLHDHDGMVLAMGNKSPSDLFSFLTPLRV